MLEWLANNYKKFGCLLEFVTDRSEEGNQFCKGFGGIGGVLRYSVSPQLLLALVLYPCVHSLCVYSPCCSKAHAIQTV